MAQASKRLRRERRIRRERTLAFRMADMALKQRDQARLFANLLGKELEKVQKAKDSFITDAVENTTSLNTPVLDGEFLVQESNESEDNQTN